VKFGLLGKDFGYKPFFTYPDHECWISAVHGDEPHPHFGGAQAIYNVIDARQSDPQANVIQALRGMGHTDAAITTRTSAMRWWRSRRAARRTRIRRFSGNLARPYIEVSGRKGFGVKADDLIDKLIAATRAEWTRARPAAPMPNPNASTSPNRSHRRAALLHAQVQRNSVIAFDFKDALSFEGETGPYIQYAVVRARNIFRKAGVSPEAVVSGVRGVRPDRRLSRSEAATDIWSLWLRAGRRTLVLEQCIATSEPGIWPSTPSSLPRSSTTSTTSTTSSPRKTRPARPSCWQPPRLALRELIVVLGWLGIESPEAM